MGQELGKGKRKGMRETWTKNRSDSRTGIRVKDERK